MLTLPPGPVSSLPDESARLTALQNLQILDTPPEAAFDRIADLATRTLDVPIAAVCFVDRDRQWFKAVRGLPMRETSRDLSFCAHAIREKDFLLVPDATHDPRFADNPLVTGETHLHFYAGAVLRTPDGQALGTLCVADLQPRQMDARQRQTLLDLAALTVDELTLRAGHPPVEAPAANGTGASQHLPDETHARHDPEEGRPLGEPGFQELFEQSSVSAFLNDARGRFTDVNPAACASLGYTREELLRLGVFDIVDPRIARAEVLRSLDLPAEQTAAFDTRHFRKDGTSFPVEVRVSSVQLPQGRSNLALARDVTERKREEALLQRRAEQQQAISQLGLRALRQDPDAGEAALDALCTEAVALASRTLGVELGNVLQRLPEPHLYLWRAVYGWPAERVGTVIAAGDGANSLTGYTLQTQAPVIVENYRTETRFHVADILLEQGTTSGATVVIHTENEAAFGTLAVHGREARQFTADDVNFLQAVANILGAAIERQAARARVQQALQEAAAARETAERANAAKSRFLSRMSHELRTPLNAVLGFAQVLELGPMANDDTACVSNILKAGRHLLGLIDEVLDIARAESGELHLLLDTVDLGRLAQDCAALVAQIALSHRIRCEVRLPRQPILLRTDERRLKQVLLNLLSNAIKYNRPGGKITLGIEQTEESRVRVRVTDMGVGLTAEAVGRLFVPFERLGQEIGGVEGTGLGLVVSRSLAEALGGRLEVESQPGVGSTFWVELPLNQPPGLPEPKAEDPPPTSTVLVSPHPPTLLYVEDNEPNLKVFQSLLGKCRPEWKVLAARDGIAGLEAARQTLPDLILLDLQLPGLTGDKVLEALRAEPATRQIPVIVLSADATPFRREALLALGVNGYLTKPFVLKELLAQLDQTLAMAATGQTAPAPAARGSSAGRNVPG